MCSIQFTQDKGTEYGFGVYIALFNVEIRSLYKSRQEPHH